jgi:hypothetical protein
MWWLLRHGDTQRRRIRYIGKVNNRVLYGKLKTAAACGDWREGETATSGASVEARNGHPAYLRRRYSILYFACVVSPVARRIKS